MRRRDFLFSLGGAAAAGPLAAQAQTSDVTKRIGVLSPYPESDKSIQAQLGLFRSALGQLGWSEGHNLRIDYRWAGGDMDRLAPLARQADGIDAAFQTLAGETDTGLLVVPDATTTANRARIVALAARLRVPAIYPFRFFADEGGLVAYGIEVGDVYRRAATYIDRILRGAAPAELPVQAPTKFELVINLKTARALGVTIPLIMQMTADEVIE